MEDLDNKMDVASSIQWILASSNQGSLLAQMTLMHRDLMKILHSDFMR